MLGASLRPLEASSTTPLHPHSSRTQIFSRLVCIRILIVLIVLMLIALITDSHSRAKLHHSIRKVVTGTLYHLSHHHVDLSSVEMFASQNPIFTKHISPKTLKKMLRARRRTIGGTVNNTLIAACSDSSPVLARTVASWNNIRGVREVVIVDYDSHREGPLRALKVIDSIDRLGRIVHVAVVRSSDTSPSEGPIGAQWERSRAFNLGAAVSSGRNLLFVDCHTITSPALVAEHPMHNGSIHVAIAQPPPTEDPASAFRWPDVVYVPRDDFLAVVGFDERIDVPGYDMADLVERMRRSRGLTWQPMQHGFTSRVDDETKHTPLAVASDWTGGTIDALVRTRLIPDLALYASMIAGQELPVWSGRLLDGSLTMLTLRPVRLGVLRKQMESTEARVAHHPLFGTKRQPDFRMWIHASLRRTQTVSMVDALPRPLRLQVLLTAHRYMLHDRHAVPWSLLKMVEDQNAPGGNADTNVTQNNSSKLIVDGTVERKLNSYSELLFDLLWRRSKLLVVSIESDDGMATLRSIAWAITSAISRNRVLVLVGSIDKTALWEVVDLKATSALLAREYNLKLHMVGRRHALNCTEGLQPTCWGSDAVGKHWVSHSVRGNPAELADDPGRHTIVRVVTRDVVDWGSAPSTWIHRLQAQAFACVAPSARVIAAVGWRGSLQGRTGLWPVDETSQVKEFVRGFMRMRRKRGPAPVVFGLRRYASGESGIRKIADVLTALRCRSVMFNAIDVPAPWRGADESVVEWRRVHVRGHADSSHGVAHVRSERNASFVYREVILGGD